jgi:hypothetical protein
MIAMCRSRRDLILVMARIDGGSMSSNRNQVAHAQNVRRVAKWKELSRRPLHVLIASLCLCLTIVLLAFTANDNFRWISLISSPEHLRVSDPDDVRIGSIQLQTNGDQCDVMKFDNDTGHVISYSRQCYDGVTPDAGGMPVPTGAIRRLGSISKSFRSDGH